MKLADDGILGVGVIGAGRIGLVHLEALARCETAKAVIISNPTVAKAEAAAEKYKLDSSSASADDVINHPDVEAVWICSPSSFHAAQIKACAAAGKHVFCEKPVASCTLSLLRYHSSSLVCCWLTACVMLDHRLRPIWRRPLRLSTPAMRRA